MKYKILLIIVWGALLVAIIYKISDSITMSKMKGVAQSTLQTNPIQTMMNPKETINMNGIEITKIAKYDITGIVVAKEYYYGSNSYGISNVDLTLAWGVAATHKDDIKIMFGLNDRTVQYAITGTLYEKYGSKATHYISNNHIIPANKTVKRALKKAKIGKVVQMTGYLVGCKAENWSWGPSSTSRTDTGGHACEIMLVETIVVK